ncbi:hypothetical protein WA158_006240 [Blastocystis sp. Blastoise]
MSDILKRTIKVGNLTELVSDPMLIALFSSCGQIVSLKVSGDHQNATIVFDSENSVNDAISRNGTELGQKAITVTRGIGLSSGSNVVVPENGVYTQKALIDLVNFILNEPPEKREALLREQKTVMTSEQQSELVLLYSKLATKKKCQEDFIAAIEAADSPNYVEPEDDASSDSDSYSSYSYSSYSSYSSRSPSRERSRSRSRDRYRREERDVRDRYTRPSQYEDRDRLRRNSRDRYRNTRDERFRDERRNSRDRMRDREYERKQYEQPRIPRRR